MRSRTTAALLALFGGFMGLHFFYLGRKGLGILSIMLFFSRVGLPVSIIVGIISFIVLLGKSDSEFDKQYNREEWRENKRRQYEGGGIPQPQPQSRRNDDARRRMNPTPQYQKPDVNHKEVLKQTGLTKYKEFDYEGAIEDFGKALGYDNTDVAVHWNLACLYSLTEQKELSFYHLQKAVEQGYKDYDKIKTHDALAYIRVQPEFEQFAFSGFKMPESMEHSDILQQLKDLTDKREKGQLSQKEFAEMTKKLYE